MTKKELSAIRQRLESAALGEWKIVNTDWNCSLVVSMSSGEVICICERYDLKPLDDNEDEYSSEREIEERYEPLHSYDAWFIANSKKDIESMLDYIEELECEIREVGARND